MRQAGQPEFKTYQQQVAKNAQALAAGLKEAGYKIVTGGTDSHLVWVDMRCAKLSGGKAELILEEVAIACNKNTVPGDKSALNPSGIRIGTPALTTRGLVEDDFKQVVAFMDQSFKLAQEIQTKSGPKLVDFKRVLHSDEEFQARIRTLKGKVEAFA